MKRKISEYAAWFLVALFGSGAAWQYLSHSLEGQKFEASQDIARLELREKITQKLLEVINVISSGATCGEKDPQQTKARATVKALKEDLTEFEDQLAVLERRQPRRDLFRDVESHPCPPPADLISVQ